MTKTSSSSLFFRGILISILLALILFAAEAWQVYCYSKKSSNKTADAALVLGAAAWGEKPSPVLRERINHALELYQAKRVKVIIFTGGTPEIHYPTEAEVSRRYALNHQVAAKDILLENTSRTTLGNLENAAQKASPLGINTYLIVSDPIHMRRAMLMAKDLKLIAYPSPTESSRYQGFWSQLKFLAKETINCIAYQLFKHLS